MWILKVAMFRKNLKLLHDCINNAVFYYYISSKADYIAYVLHVGPNRIARFSQFKNNCGKVRGCYRTNHIPQQQQSWKKKKKDRRDDRADDHSVSSLHHQLLVLPDRLLHYQCIWCSGDGGSSSGETITSMKKRIINKWKLLCHYILHWIMPDLV